jgi:phosphoribosylanthranilate isomerase
VINGIQLKICGLTTAEDAAAAADIGADYLAFNLAPSSPRRIALGDYAALAPRLPDLPRVAVAVEPSMDALAAMQTAGFAAYQLHFRHDLPLAELAAWSEAVGPERLWLAPRLPPGFEVAPAWLPLARTFLLDTFHAGFGGSGRVGDWPKFARHRQAHPDHAWILAGGLRPDNVAEAVRQSGARWIDVNSGVESAPGHKDAAKLAALRAALLAG